MATIKFTITEDMIKLISNLTFQKVKTIEELEDETKETVTWGLDFSNLYAGNNSTFENIAFLIGRYDEHIPETEEKPLGAEFPKELEDYMWELHCNIIENIGYIEEIVHQFCGRGGIKPGTYKCKSNERIWELI